jgi:hypothetical protein
MQNLINKNNKKQLLSFFLFLLFLFLSTSRIQADLLLPGQKSINSCFQIENIKDYPDYTFILYPTYVGGSFKIIKQEDCLSFYKMSSPKIYAIKTENFNSNDIKNSNPEDKKNNYFINNHNLIVSDLNIRLISALPKNDPREKIVDIYKIQLLNSQILKIKPTKSIYTYNDDTTQEKPYKALKFFPPLIFFPIVTILIEFFVLLLFIRKPLSTTLLYTTIINLTTWFPANYFYQKNSTYFLPTEFIVFLSESLLIIFFFKTKYKKALLLSFIANLLTASLTFVI